MSFNPIGAYQDIEKETLTGRSLEASVLFKSAGKLKRVQESWDASGRDELLEEALRYNQQIWSLFQAELTDTTSELPADIRTNLLNLSVFVDKRTFEIMAYPSPEKLNILIDINQNIAAGLGSGQ